MKDQRPTWLIKTSAIQRYCLWHWAASVDNIHVSEFPKSGGTWFCQMLSMLTGIPFPRHQFVSLRKSILHSHHSILPQHKNPIAIVRDGRDVMISAYYHFLISKGEEISFLVKKWRKLMPFENYENVAKNLPQFIEVFFKNYEVGRKNVTWSAYIHELLQKQNILIVKYENLLSRPYEELKRTLEHLQINRTDEQINEAISFYSFQNQANRMPGNEDVASFLRKGISGDWKNKFTKESCVLFEKLAGEELRLMEYALDSDWHKDIVT